MSLAFKGLHYTQLSRRGTKPVEEKTCHRKAGPAGCAVKFSFPRSIVYSCIYTLQLLICFGIKVQLDTAVQHRPPGLFCKFSALPPSNIRMMCQELQSRCLPPDPELYE